MAAKITKTLKLMPSHNKQRTRIVIKGYDLLDAGWDCGDKFSKTWGEETLVLIRSKDDPKQSLGLVGKSRQLPLINISNRKVNDVFGCCSHVTVRFLDTSIVITRKK